MDRALVIGSPGAGKSTFARRLQAKTGLPLRYLDMIWHRPDHTTVPTDEFDAKLAEILEEPRWIIDGNYVRTLPRRLEPADTVFFLDYPAELCLRGIRERLGTKREDMPWEPEDALDPEFEQYVRFFPVLKRPILTEILDETPAEKQVYTFHSREEAQAFLDALP